MLGPVCRFDVCRTPCHQVVISTGLAHSPAARIPAGAEGVQGCTTPTRTTTRRSMRPCDASGPPAGAPRNLAPRPRVRQNPPGRSGRTRPSEGDTTATPRERGHRRGRIRAGPPVTSLIPGRTSPTHRRCRPRATAFSRRRRRVRRTPTRQVIRSSSWDSTSSSCVSASIPGAAGAATTEAPEAGCLPSEQHASTSRTSSACRAGDLVESTGSAM